MRMKMIVAELELGQAVIGGIIDFGSGTLLGRLQMLQAKRREHVTRVRSNLDRLKLKVPPMSIASAN